MAKKILENLYNHQQVFACHLYFCIISMEIANFSVNFAKNVFGFFLGLFCRSLAFSCENCLATLECFFNFRFKRKSFCFKTCYIMEAAENNVVDDERGYVFCSALSRNTYFLYC